MKKFSIFSVLGLITIGAGLASAEEQPAFLQFVRPLGMGGAFTAVADDQNIFSFNPAGMVQRTGGQLTVLEIAVGGSDDLKDAADFISDNEDKLTNFENLTGQEQAALVNEINNDISQLDPRLTVGADVASYVSGPSFLGMPLHAGFGLFGIVDASFRLDSGVSIPNISFEINNDIVLPISVAHRWEAPWIIPGKIGAGFTGKFIRRNQVSQNNLSVLQLDDLESPPVAKGKGVGADLGFLYQPTDRTNVGVMIQDFLGTKISYDKVDAEEGYPAQPERDTVIRPRTNVGLAINPQSLLWLLPTGDRWTFSADVRDITGGENEHIFFEDGFKHIFGDNLPTHLHLGTEFRYWFLRFRGGAYQGYPTFGLGIDIPILKIDYAFYSKELGFHAGDNRQETHIISLALRFGSGATESRERITKSKDAKKTKDMAVPEAETAPAETVPVPSAESAPTQKSAPSGQDLPE